MSEAWRILVRRTGGPEVLERQEMPLPAPGPGEILVRHAAIGLNFIDVYFRTGLYPVALPTGLGSEAAGIVEAVGDGVTGFVPGDRVGYVTLALGSYATHRAVPARYVVKLPDGIDFETAAAVLLKGCTAEFLIERCAKVQAGDVVLVHAAAGGVGSILVPWLKAVGATVIAHAGSRAKADAAAALGADHALSCPFDALAQQVRALTGDDGARVVLDGVGAASWDASLASLAKRGLLVSYGNASGPAPAVEPRALGAAGSIFLTRPSLFDYVATEAEMRASAGRLFALILDGTIRPRIGARFPLAEAAEAHRALEARQTTGSTLLIP